ncbi:MAG: T9SS type B sorting domain-containing protein [Flavobacteriales bacterium]
MRKRSVMFGWVSACFVVAQNLVPNGDFEAFTQCPDYVSQIDRATGWFRPTEGTSDYLNACLQVPWSLSVPDNSFGNEAAHSGQGYAGFYCFYANDATGVPGDDDREYVTHALAEPLIPGSTYAVEFFVSLADVSKYAVRDIGALLSMEAPSRNDELTIEAAPHVHHTALTWLDEKDGWMRIHGCLVADSAYAYITIGYFEPAANTDFVEVPTAYPLTYFSYYFVDDVSVRSVQRPDAGPDIRSCDAVTIMVMDPLPDTQYHWNTGVSGSRITTDTAGTFIVTSNTDGCMLHDTVRVEIPPTLIPLLPADTLVDLCRWPYVRIEAAGLPADAAIQWSMGSTSATIVVDTPGQYTIRAESPEHCPGEAHINVIDTCSTPLLIANTFTPNGDGVNDQWGPVWGMREPADMELWLYDRWGSVILVLHPYGSAWDGSINGVPAPEGLYPWKCRIRGTETDADRTWSGHVSLLR